MVKHNYYTGLQLCEKHYVDSSEDENHFTNQKTLMLSVGTKFAIRGIEPKIQFVCASQKDNASRTWTIHYVGQENEKLYTVNAMKVLDEIVSVDEEGEERCTDILDMFMVEEAAANQKVIIESNRKRNVKRLRDEARGASKNGQDQAVEEIELHARIERMQEKLDKSKRQRKELKKQLHMKEVEVARWEGRFNAIP